MFADADDRAYFLNIYMSAAIPTPKRTLAAFCEGETNT